MERTYTYNKTAMVEALERMGWNRRALADCCNLSYDSFTRRVNGKTMWCLPEVKILMVLGFTADDFEAAFGFPWNRR